MDLWHGTLSAFVDDAESGVIATEMLGRYHGYHGRQPSEGETRSWQNSLAALGRALRPLVVRGAYRAPAVVVGDLLGADAGAVFGDPSVVLEYHLPLSLKRIDVILTGKSALGDRRCLVIELKQWSTAGFVDDLTENYNVSAHGEIHLHPSEQAASYADSLNKCQGAFTEGTLHATALSYCHELGAPGAKVLRAPRFAETLAKAPLFARGDEDALRAYVRDQVGYGDGPAVMEALAASRFRPGKGVMESVDAVLRGEERWVLLDEQRIAFNHILAEVKLAVSYKANTKDSKAATVVIVRGGPGTGKTVIAMQLIAAALKLKWSAAHSTGGKAFTTALRSKFKGADDIFIWNLSTRKAAFKGIDLLLVDEAHRVRLTSKTRFTPKADVSDRSQAEELIDAARVTVFFLDENQFVRPDEIGSTATLLEAARAREARVKVVDLVTQFRCGGATEYSDWVDYLLHFRDDRPTSWGTSYKLHLVDGPEALDAMLERSRSEGKTARLAAGFCWPWSNPGADGALVADVQIGAWSRPWNRKAAEKAYKPADHPYTRWAETDEGIGQVGCIYSAQGFEFQRVGVIWGPDLVWRDGAWVGQKQHSEDTPVARSKDKMEVLVRNAYRVLLTRGMEECHLLVLDPETRAHVAELLTGMQG